MIAVHQLTKRYGRRTVLAGVDLDVAPGECVALWGPNGAGKTTLLHCLLGLTPCQGWVQVAGLDPRRHGPAVRRQVGYVPQDLPALDMTVAQALSLIASLRGASQNDAYGLAERWGMAPCLALPVTSLSGGQRQRLAVVLALLGDPAVLLLDEPTANLDPDGQELLLAEVTRLRQRGRAVVFASHRVAEVARVAGRVACLAEGRIAAWRDPSDLRGHLGDAHRGVKPWVTVPS